MGVNIECHTRIGVTHQVLKVLDVHAIVCIVGAEGMPEHMRGDVGQGAVRMQLFVLLHCPSHLVLDVQRHLGITVLVQHDEAAVATYNRLTLDLGTVFQHLFQSIIDRSWAETGIRYWSWFLPHSICRHVPEPADDLHGFCGS